jgi:hypothetical protein
MHEANIAQLLVVNNTSVKENALCLNFFVLFCLTTLTLAQLVHHMTQKTVNNKLEKMLEEAIIHNMGYFLAFSGGSKLNYEKSQTEQPNSGSTLAPRTSQL